MRKIQIIGLAFAAVFAFSMISVSGASAFTLWDECSTEASPLAFTSADCNASGTAWGWLEITALLTIDSLLSELELENFGLVTIKILCLGSLVGSVGASGEDEVTELLNEAGEQISLAKLVTCEDIQNCANPLAAPLNLPWRSQLVDATAEDAAGDLLIQKSGAGGPGWFAECGGTGNECTKEDTILKTENKEAELEVVLLFPAVSELTNLPLASCTNGFEKEGAVKGTVGILLTGPERALRMM